MTDVILYRWRPEWDLPSLSLGCIQVEVRKRGLLVDITIFTYAASLVIKQS